MILRSLKPLALSLAVVTTLAACQREASAPDAGAAPPAAKLSIDLANVSAQPIAFNAADIDPNVNACQDLNGYVNAKWLAANPVPADRTSWGAFPALGERSLHVQHEIAKAAAAGQWPAGSMEQKVGDFFAAGMDQAAIDAAGIAPLEPALDRIDAIADASEIPAYLRGAYAEARGMLFNLFGAPDVKDSGVNIANVSQGGLSLPERAYYLEDRDDYKTARVAFVEHVAKLLELAGSEAATARVQAEQVMAFETRLARASMERLKLRDPANRYNPVSMAEAEALTPNFSWTAMFDSLGVAQPQMFSLAQPDFFREFDRMLVDVPLDEWKTWLRFKAIDDAAPYLGSAFEQQSFEFYRKTLAGQQEQQERWKRVLGALNRSIGEGFGQLYVAQAFPPESKAKMEQLVGNLREALRHRLDLEWMSDETKEKAIEKWSTFTPKIGYPDKWRDWSGLEFRRDSFFANIEAAAGFNYRWNLSKIGKPVDRSEWGMSPQTVNAYYRATANEVVFPAAILQPPFFDPNADDALNYGGIGGVIGHEMLHGFDDQGSKFDATGNMQNWWTDDDRQRFEQRTARLAAQFDQYEALPGLFVNGKLGLGENIADLGGVTVALEALRRQQGDNYTDPMVDGLSQTQRFFLNWATVWRIAFTEAQLRQQITVGPHSPGMFRAIAPASNMPAFSEAFGCSEGDKMVRGDGERVSIW